MSAICRTRSASTTISPRAQNLRYTAKLAGIPRDEIEDRIQDGMKRVRLADVGDNRVGTFSHGMKRRLGLAEVIMKRAEVAILDEPTSGLDPQATFEFLDMIRGLKADRVAVLLSSHMLDQVQAVCDRVALFNRGKIAIEGTVEALSKQVLGGGYGVEIEAVGTNLTTRLRRHRRRAARHRDGQRQI